MLKIKQDRKYCIDNRVIVPSTNYTESFVKSGVTLQGSFNLNFNQQLYKLIQHSPISVLDLGCGNGNFIKSIIEEGHFGVGLDGFYIYEKFKPASWDIISDNLLMCDVSTPFVILKDEEIIKFDIITSWEFMEHLYEEDLDGTIQNITENLKDKGYYICSISYATDSGHFIIRDRGWWKLKFEQYNLVECLDLNSFFKEYPRDCSDSHYFILKKFRKEEK